MLTNAAEDDVSTADSDAMLIMPGEGEQEVKVEKKNNFSVSNKFPQKKIIHYKGCWYHFSRFIGGMWSTREMDGAKDREVYVRTTIRFANEQQ